MLSALLLLNIGRVYTSELRYCCECKYLIIYARISCFSAQQEFIRCVRRASTPNNCIVENALYLRNRLIERVIAEHEEKCCYDLNMCDEHGSGYIGDLLASLKTAQWIRNILYLLIFSLSILLCIVCYFKYAPSENSVQNDNFEMVAL